MSGRLLFVSDALTCSQAAFIIGYINYLKVKTE